MVWTRLAAPWRLGTACGKVHGRRQGANLHAALSWPPARTLVLEALPTHTEAPASCVLIHHEAAATARPQHARLQVSRVREVRAGLISCQRTP